MDGNGRWAQQRRLPRIAGHRKGASSLEAVLKAAHQMGIRYMTLYAFSVENWQRPEREVTALMRMLEEFLKKAKQQLIKNRICLKMIGQLEGLPLSVQTLLKDLILLSSDYNAFTLILALNYGARTEIIDAIKAYSQAVAAGRETLDVLNWNHFSRYLYTDGIPDPDLVIRTSGEKRLSNFLLAQCAYSELYFTDTLWPDFGPREFHQAIEHYCHRQRRFGKTSAQVAMPAVKPQPHLV